MTIYLLNSFSANMLADLPVSVVFTELSAAEATAELQRQGFVSAVGHDDTAIIMTRILGVYVPCSRSTVLLRRGDKALIGQYSGPRLSEGTTTLPSEAAIKWILVDIVD